MIVEFAGACLVGLCAIVGIVRKTPKQADTGTIQTLGRVTFALQRVGIHQIVSGAQVGTWSSEHSHESMDDQENTARERVEIYGRGCPRRSIALIRAKLESLYGPCVTEAGDTNSFEYHFRASVEGAGDVYFTARDWKARRVYLYWEFTSSSALARANVEAAFWQLIAAAPASDFVAAFAYGDSDGAEYGCADGQPWADRRPNAYR